MDFLLMIPPLLLFFQAITDQFIPLAEAEDFYDENGR